MATFAHDPAHFVPMAKIPIVDITTSLGEAYDVLGQRRVGGLILRNRTKPVSYVTAPFLEHAVLDSRLGGIARAARMPVADYLREYMPSEQPPDVSGLPGHTVEHFAFEVASGPVLYGAAVGPLLRASPRVYAVMRGNRQAGWFLSRDYLARSITTKSRIWMCKNPEESHPNRSFDSGYCGRCEFELKT